MVAALSHCLTRKRRWALPLASGLLLLTTLAGCQPDQPAQAARPPAPVALPAPAPPARPRPPLPEPTERPDTERYWVSAATRCYVGTVGADSATVALTWVRPDSAVGRFYGWRQAAEYELTTRSRHHSGRLLLRVPGQWGLLSGAEVSGYWQLTSGPGPRLRGYWRDRAGRRQTVDLRESYQRSVRYTLENLSLTGPDTDQGRTHHESDFLRVLDGPAGSRRLARQLCLGRARQRDIVLDTEGQAYCTSTLDVRLNDFGLLSYYRHGLIDPIEGTSDEFLTAWLFDLTTGQELTVASQLRPGYQRALRRLLTHELLHNPRFNYLDPELHPGAPAAWPWQDEPHRPATLVSLPNKEEALALTAAGLEATYCANTLFENNGPLDPRFPVVVPYRTLRPLVRPGTPLARMLAARKLW